MLLWYIDNEVPDFGEWTAIVQNDPSTVGRTTYASFPGRGSYGLRVIIVGTSSAYVRKDFTYQIPPGGSLYVGVWMKFSAPGTDPLLWRIASGANQAMYVGIYGGTKALYARIYNDGGGQHGAGQITTALTPGNWQYVVAKLTRAETDVSADGSLDIYTNGDVTNIASGVDNYDCLDSSSLKFYFGGMVGISDGFILDFDEIKAATTYPEPFVPTPTGELLTADRVAVLVRAGDAYSEDFATHCITALGIPPANIIKLPSASGTESLADFATWQSQVEDFIATYFTLNPTVAANAMCFLLGYDVPAYFFSGGVKYSGVSRLMSYGQGLSLGKANPFYNPSTVSRLTKTALDANYLATRIDLANLADADNVTDQGVGRSGLSELADADTLFSPDATYRASLPCQKLRIVTANMTTGTTLANDAFCDLAWGTTAPTWGSASNRCAFISTTAGSARTLRDDTDDYAKQVVTALQDNLYAGAFGYSETVDGFDSESFFEMLRIGGTLAEAFLVAIPSLDYTTVPLGESLMTVSFQVGGYNIYRGIGGKGAIDYASPVACLRPGVTSAQLVGLCPDEDVDYYFAVRAVSNAGVEETNTDKVVRARISGGALVGPPPNDIDERQAYAEAVAGGKVRLHVYYNARGQAAAATGIQVARRTDPQSAPDWSSLIQTISIGGSRRIAVILDPTFSDGEMVYLAVRAVTQAGATGRPAYLAPVVADTTAPPAVSYVEAQQST